MTTNIVDKDGNSINAADATVPSDRHFRDAWSLSGSTITEDLTAAKVIFKEKIREVRTPLLAKQDVAYMKALEGDDSDAQTTAKNAKTALRNAPAASAITNAANIGALKSAWDADVLGDSPYAQENQMALTKVIGSGVQGIANASNATFLTATSAEGVTLAGTLAVTGVHTIGNNAVATSEGGAVTMSAIQGLAKQWSRVSGAGMSVSDSFNTSSVTDSATGKAAPVFTSAMSATTYNTVFGGDDKQDGGGVFVVNINDAVTQATTGYGFSVKKQSASAVAFADLNQNGSSTVFGDLA